MGYKLNRRLRPFIMERFALHMEALGVRRLRRYCSVGRGAEALASIVLRAIDCRGAMSEARRIVAGAPYSCVIGDDAWSMGYWRDEMTARFGTWYGENRDTGLLGWEDTRGTAMFGAVRQSAFVMALGQAGRDPNGEPHEPRECAGAVSRILMARNLPITPDMLLDACDGHDLTPIIPTVMIKDRRSGAYRMRRNPPTGPNKETDKRITAWFRGMLGGLLLDRHIDALHRLGTIGGTETIDGIGAPCPFHGHDAGDGHGTPIGRACGTDGDAVFSASVESAWRMLTETGPLAGLYGRVPSRREDRNRDMAFLAPFPTTLLALSRADRGVLAGMTGDRMAPRTLAISYGQMGEHNLIAWFMREGLGRLIDLALGLEAAADGFPAELAAQDLADAIDHAEEHGGAWGGPVPGAMRMADLIRRAEANGADVRGMLLAPPRAPETITTDAG